MPLPFPYSVRQEWMLWGLKEKLKKPLINPWRLNPARYRQNFSSASFLEQEHETAFLLQLFLGDSQAQRRIQRILQSFFYGENGCQGSLTNVPGPWGIKEPLLRLLEAFTCWEETFRVQGQVCLSSLLTDVNCYAIFRKSLLSDSIQFLRLRAWKNKY